MPTPRWGAHRFPRHTEADNLWASTAQCGLGRLVPAILALFVAAATCCGASVPWPASFDPYVVHVWQMEHGLPQNHITAITQTRDGFLWLATYEGLTRFDGVRFVTFNAAREPGLPSSRITSLFEDPHGALWIGHEHGQLSRLVNGRFEAVLPNTVSPEGSIVALGIDGSGDLWFLRRSGVAERHRDRQTVPTLDGRTLPVFCREPRGPDAPAASLWRVHAGQMTELGKTNARPQTSSWTNEFVLNACASRQGLWILTSSRLRHWNRDGTVFDAGSAPWADHPVPRLLEDRSGQLWVGTQELGLFIRLQDGQYLHYSLTNGLTSDWIRSLWEDREGTVWVGTGGGGLCAFRPRKIRMVQAPDRWQGRGLLAVSPSRNGDVWVGTEGAGLYHLTPDGVSRIGTESGLANTYVWSVLDDGIHAPWAGTWGQGLFQLQRPGKRWASVPGLDANGLVVTALHAGSNDVLWIGTQRGLARLAEGHVEWIGQDLISPEVRCIAEAGDGTIWFGMAGGGLGRWSGGRAYQLRKPDGLPSNDVWSLLPAADGSVWIGTVGGGLCRWKQGRISVINERHGLPSDVICQIIEDRETLWLGTRGGIVRAARAELEQCADGRATAASFFVYGMAEGLATLECSGGSQPAHGRAQDGTLLFPTSRGLAVVDPARLTTNGLAPPVVIESVSISGQKTPLAGSGPTRIVIPPGRQRLEIEFTATTFVAPERVRFQHRLDGLDEHWTSLSGPRSVSYNFLPPGHYTFRVQACNADGVWNTTGASLPIRVMPRLWQTWWFQAGAGAGVVLAIGAAARVVARRRYRRKLEQIERQRAIERERSRIARDIHDDLGASLTRITLLSQTAAEDLHQPAVVGAHLQRIDATARELTKALEEIVWAINPRHDTLDSLVTYLGRLAQDLAAAAGVRCRIDMPAVLPAWPIMADVRHNLFLAFKEALHNAIRHASAGQITLALQFDVRGFTLRVEDDGVGFELDSLAPTQCSPGRGNGIENMRRRLEEIGARCDIRSQPGAGTTVTFVIKTDDKASPGAIPRLPP